MRRRHRHGAVREHRFDNFAAPSAAGKDHLVRLFRHQQAGGGQIGQHRLARRVTIETTILLRRVVVDLRLQREDRQRLEFVPLCDLPVVEVVCGRDLHGAGAELALDVVIGDSESCGGRWQRDFAPTR